MEKSAATATAPSAAIEDVDNVVVLETANDGFETTSNDDQSS